ncbi:MAG: carbohydrate ABC transporter permease [Lentisphaerae bacterium]|nr:carbohydrate ABC transporter permease [Lentisphaerota bacterium]
MPITSQIGRRHWKIRALFASMYIFLILGSITMVFPFMLMISGSTKSAVDIKYFDLIPRFLHDDVWLYRKHMEGLFNEGMDVLNTAYYRSDTAFEYVTPPEEPKDRLVDAYEHFLKETDLPAYSYTIGYMAAKVSRTMPSGLRNFKAHLRQECSSDIGTINATLGTSFPEWNALTIQEAELLVRRDQPREGAFFDMFRTFEAEHPLGLRYYFSPEGHFLKGYLRPLYGAQIADYNTSHQTAYTAYSELHLAQTYAEAGTPKEKEDWEFFVRSNLALQWLRVADSAAPVYREFLKAKHGRIATLNRRYATAYNSFNEIALVDEPPTSGMVLSDWAAFITGWQDTDGGKTFEAPTEALRVHSTEFIFRDHLLTRYGSIAGINAALGTSYRKPIDIRLPQREQHYRYYTANRKALRWEFITRNYRTVSDYMLFHGRGIINTVIYCTLAVLSALIVNPLAAYAMSRYRLPSSYKILLFLMCTMAFPPMVTAIPNFIMLRRLGLLNTFAALILPGMANGYSIFLLKGFFDAQPQELYESAQLDGAGEWTIFWQITMKLSKPILAVIALAAFTMAYSNFMFAFVVCQDEKMWTLMVWLYQLQQRSGQAVMYASLLIAAIPTFLIFVFCQNIIMRGIVVPSEK